MRTTYADKKRAISRSCLKSVKPTRFDFSKQPAPLTKALSNNRVLTFREFVDLVKPKYIWYRHCVELAATLQRVADGEISRVLIQMPPRHGKSELVSRLFSAYYLYRHPERWVGLTSYAADLAYTLARASHENFRSASGQFKTASRAVKHAETADGGGMWAAGVGGPITGKGFHLGIIDDPIKNAEEAASELIRAKQKDWYGSTFYTREEPGGAVVIVQTRWHEDDLTGYLLAEETEEEPEQWTVLCYAAIREEESPEFPASCTVIPDWREPGEPLCPERYLIEKLNKLKSKIGGYFFDALFQQRPSAKEGSFFKVAMFEIVAAVPAKLQKCRAWDLAASAGKGDFTAGAKLGKDSDGIFYVLDVWSEQASSDGVRRALLQTAALDGKETAIHIPQDPGQAGKDQIQQLIRMLAGYSVKGEPVSGAKETRWFGYSAQVNAGNVKLLLGDWNKGFIEEHRQAPTGKHDDRIDAAADAFNEIALPKRIANAY